MKSSELEVRQSIVDTCRQMNAIGINQGTSGNVSVRFEDQMLITPSAVPYDSMTAEMVVSVPLTGKPASLELEGGLKPSTEWRFHHSLLASNADTQAVVHAHPPFCTMLAILRRSIPACHYMIAAFGGNDVKCSDYATFGTEDLANHAIAAMRDRKACLLANHGMIAVGHSLAEALWRAVELEAIAKQYHGALQIGEPVILADSDIEDTLSMFADYGYKSEK